MPPIPYVNPEMVVDPEIKGYLERARREGTPRPETQAVTSFVPSRKHGTSPFVTASPITH